MSRSRVEQQFCHVLAVDGYGRQQAQRVMTPYRQARECLLTTSTAARVQPTPTAAVALRELPCWSFFRGRLPAAPREDTLGDLLRLGGLHPSASAASSAAVVAETAEWSPDELEHRHDYIQWLFPLRESGVNPYAPLLTDRDVLELRADGLAMSHVLCAFQVMLRFYGMRLTLSPAAAVPADASVNTPATYTATFRRNHKRRQEQQAQYANLCRHGHNFLRISRILQFLGEVGLEPLKVAWLRFLARDVLVPPLTATPRTEGEEAHSRASNTPDTEYSSDEKEGDASPDTVTSSPQPPLAACTSSFATFWIETPYDADVRSRLKEESLELLRRVEAAAAGDAAAKEALQWATGKGPVVRSAAFTLPATAPVAALPFYVATPAGGRALTRTAANNARGKRTRPSS